MSFAVKAMIVRRPANSIISKPPSSNSSRDVSRDTELYYTIAYTSLFHAPAVVQHSPCPLRDFQVHFQAATAQDLRFPSIPSQLIFTFYHSYIDRSFEFGFLSLMLDLFRKALIIILGIPRVDSRFGDDVLEVSNYKRSVKKSAIGGTSKSAIKE